MINKFQKIAKKIAQKDIIFLYPKKNKKLVKRLIHEGEKINKNYHYLTKQVRRYGYICPETEWIFDHFYLIKHRWIDLKSNFDKKNFFSLPQMGSGPLKGHPRLYNLIVQYLLSSNNKVNSKQLTYFLNEYQGHNPLLISELNSLPQTITLEVILNFNKKIKETIKKTDQINRADKAFKNIFIKGEGDVRQYLSFLHDEIKTEEIYYIERLWQKLEGDKIYHRIIKRWIESFLRSNETDITAINHRIKKEKNQSEAFFANTINALKWLSNINWPNLIENINAVEKILSRDPAKAYQYMDERGKHLYQRKIQIIAKKFKIKELDIAKNIISLASASTNNHVGYFLIREGYKDLERAFQYKRKLLDKIKESIIKTKTAWYFGAVFLFAFLLSFSISYFLPFLSLSLTFLFSFLIFLLSLEISIILINYLILRFVPPNIPVRLGYKKIPEESKTIIVVHSILNKKETIDSVVSRLEINYLNSQDDQIFYGVLFDFKDAKQEKEKNDEELLTYAYSKIKELNEKYDNKFFLFNRKRVWNPVERLFMGWERKRGKLMEFNRLLLGSKTTSFFQPCPESLKGIKYVITLDEDNIIPKESAKLLIGTLAHPLNRPVYDEDKKRIISGYSVVQPHIGIRLPETQSSLFAKIFSLPTIADPHTHALSDLYQDIFGSGSYVGKGAYDLKSFSDVLEKKIPENTILSHDLLEGCYARTALASDLFFYEKFPSQFNVYLHRMHRWIRGDWQVIDWLFPKVKNALNEKEKNRLPFLEKWKIFDNLRRSLLSLFFIFGLAVGIYFDFSPLIFLALTAFVLPFVLPLFSYLTKRHKKISFLNCLLRFKQISLTGLNQIVFRFIFLPAHCYIELSAIFHVFFRKFITKRKLLEWQCYQSLISQLKGSLWENLELMTIPFVFSLALLIYSVKSQELILIPPAFIWSLSPIIGFLISRPQTNEPNLNEKEKTLLRKWAIRSWTYYQVFVDEKTNFLPPDNVREKEKIYYYTSPTNIGTYLLSMTSAKILSLLTPSEFIAKAHSCLRTIEKLPKEKGHLYNWYNIRTLRATSHEYLSSVDSGNFIASLIVLKQALEEMKKDNFLIPEEIQEAIRGYLLIIKENIPSVVQNEQTKRLNKGISRYLNKENTIRLPAVNALLTDFLNQFSSNPNKELLFWTKTTKERIDLFTERSSYLIDQRLLEESLNRISNIIRETNFSFLYDKEESLFKIGYNIINKKWDDASYDLLGSEANITSFLSIALNQIKQTHWRKLNRTLISANGKPVLLSWGGSLFEHINNFVFFKNTPGSLLTENGKKIIESHIGYAKKSKIPWGMSEAAHFVSETDSEIGYRVFGVPKIGIKRDLIEYKVVSPYSSFLSLSLNPKKAIKNLSRLKRAGCFGKFGFYDSIDFSNSPRVISSYYAHHIGFSLSSICNCLKKSKIQNLFWSYPYTAAAQYLLEELYLVDSKISQLPKKEFYPKDIFSETAGLPIKEFIPTQTQMPQSIFLSNGNLTSMISNNGASFLFNKKIEFTPFSRFKQGIQGWQIYLKDKDNNFEWSVLSPQQKSRVAFHENLAEFNVKRENLEVETEITVSPHENIEVRKVTLINHSEKTKNIELKTQGEAVLANQQKELLSPYFHRLFLRLNILPRKKAWLINRSYLFPDDQDLSLVHWISSPHKRINIKLSLEKSHPKRKRWFSLRAQFGNTANFKLKPKEKITLYCLTGSLSSKQKLKAVIKKYNRAKYCQDLFADINKQEAHYLHSLNTNYAKAKNYRKLGSKIFWQEPEIRFPSDSAQTQKRDFLWRFGISGTLPLVIFAAKNIDDLSSVRDFINAFSYLKFKGVKFDLVILDEEEKSYIEPLREQLEVIIQKKENVHVVFKNNFTEEELISLKSLAIGIFPSQENSLINKKEQNDQNYFNCKCDREERKENQAISFFNEYGGFINKGKEYLVSINKNRYPTHPWSNFLTNEYFGCITSHYGLGPTWYLNSQQNRLTPWNLSPVKKQISEALYLKEGKCIWSLTLSPLPNNNDYKVIHGRGYTEYQNENHGIETTLRVFIQENCKFYKLNIKNNTKQEKKVSLFSYFPLVLGSFSETQIPLQIKKRDCWFLGEQIMENSVGNTKIGVWSKDEISSYSSYQPNIFSRNNNLSIPDLTLKKELNINSYPCISFVNQFIIPAQEKKDSLILMVADSSEEKIKEVIEKNKRISLKKEEEEPKIKIKTPSPSLDILFNHWLLYQTISSRLQAKTGTYQQGGAFGFRDQIQDLLALIYIDPAKVRKMLIHFSGKQFQEGDVLNWWQEPEGLGSRSLISDVHLWLPFVLANYIERTGDESILEEEAPYLKGRAVEFEKEESWVGVPEETDQKESLYKHAVKAIEKSLHFGKNKLPLMGTADWNDGLTLIGRKGKGESVWLAFFLYYNLSHFIDIAKKREDLLITKKLTRRKSDLKKAILSSSWDGKWFVRAFHDRGTAIGSEKNKACKIDLITQAWSIITEVADKGKEERIIKAVLDLLYDKKNGIISLFTPPVSSESKLPYGYVQGYPENVRENGGQYNHAAVWFLEAATKAKRSDLIEDLIRTIDPIIKSETREKAERYKVEPYVIAADIGKEKDRPGQGGWTWYTASGGLFYKTILENVLGLKLISGKMLSIDPCLPAKWKECEVSYRHGETNYHIKILNKSLTGFGVKSCTFEGKEISTKKIPLNEDKKEREIIVIL